jgi:hypothetical protein
LAIGSQQGLWLSCALPVPLPVESWLALQPREWQQQGPWLALALPVPLPVESWLALQLRE